MIKNLIQSVIDKIKDIILDKVKNLDLDKDGILDTKQIQSFIERGHALSTRTLEAVHVPTLQEAAEHAKVALEALKRAIDEKALGSIIEDAKLLFKDIVAFGKKAMEGLKK